MIITALVDPLHGIESSKPISSSVLGNSGVQEAIIKMNNYAY